MVSESNEVPFKGPQSRNVQSVSCRRWMQSTKPAVLIRFGGSGSDFHLFEFPDGVTVLILLFVHLHQLLLQSLHLRLLLLQDRNTDVRTTSLEGRPLTLNPADRGIRLENKPIKSN